jgi:hypothetical protein
VIKMGFEFEKRKQGVGTDLDWALLRTPIVAYATCGSDRWHAVENLRVAPEDLSLGELDRSISKLEWKIELEQNGVRFHESALRTGWGDPENQVKGIEQHQETIKELQGELSHYKSVREQKEDSAQFSGLKREKIGFRL